MKEDIVPVPIQEASPAKLSWGLCVATLNRIDILKQSIKLALLQTIPPKEIIIVDAGENWMENFAVIRGLCEWQEVTLTYRHSEIRSLTRQRNQALSLATADILFFFDDDTLMHSDCAEQILRVFSLDADRQIAAVAASQTPLKPSAAKTHAVPSKDLSRSRGSHIVFGMLPQSVKRFMESEVLMLSLERRFVPYDGLGYPTHPPLEPRICETGAFPIKLISGFRLTVRRSVAENEPFDGGLIAYCPAEDLDATYRYLRHGCNVQAPLALVYHHEAKAARLKRKKVAELSLLNVAYFVRGKSATPALHAILYYLFSIRMLVSCALRDVIGRRWELPDTIGSLLAIRKSFIVFQTSIADLEKSYVVMQKHILSLDTSNNSPST